MKRFSIRGHSVKRILGCVMVSALVLVNIPWMRAQAAESVVYVSGSGSSTNSGSESTSPISSIYSAQQRLTEGGTIIVTGTFYISSDRSYSLNSNIVVKASPEFSGPIFEVAEGGKLILNNIVINGSTSTLISNRGYLNIGDGVVFQKAGDILSATEAVSTGNSASTYKGGTLLEGVPQKTEAEESESAQENTSQNNQGQSESSQSESNGETSGSESGQSEGAGGTQQSEPNQSGNTGGTAQSGPNQSGNTGGTAQSGLNQSGAAGGTSQSEPNQSGNAGGTSQSGSNQSENTGGTVQSEPNQSGSAGNAAQSEPNQTGNAGETSQSESGQGESNGSTSQIEESESASNSKPNQEGGDPEEPNETEAGQPIRSKESIAVEADIRSLSVHGREDVAEVLRVSSRYDSLNKADRMALPKESGKLLSIAQGMAEAYNHTQKGVSVSGNIPWYVQLLVKKLDITEARREGLEILVPYELELKNLYTDEDYILAEGEQVTVTMPVPNIEINGSFTVFHYKSDGSIDTIEPRIEGKRMSFETSSFSPFSVAGSTVIAGIGVANPEDGTAGKDEANAPSGSSSAGSTIYAGVGSAADRGTEGSSPQTETKSPQTNSSSSNGPNQTLAAANTGDDTEVHGYLFFMIAAFLVMTGTVGLKKKKVR